MMSPGFKLVSRISILGTSKNLPAKNAITLQWYNRYAEAVLSALQHPRFQRFLSWLIQHEHIPLQRIKAIYVRMFPRIKANGHHLNGASTSHGIITLYPHALPKNPSARDLTQWWGFSLKYIQWKARATLIHELLHYKYRYREQHVRQLTQQYTRRCMQPLSRPMQCIFMRIFRKPAYRITASRV